MATTKTIETRNRAWGWWGTLVHAGKDEATVRQMWDKMIGVLHAGFGLELTHARDLLDSGFGRHLADTVAHVGPDEMEATLPQWIGKEIGRFNRTYRAADYDAAAE